VPDLETLEYLIQLPIPKDTLLNYELWTLQKLGWKLNGMHSFEPSLFPLVYCIVYFMWLHSSNNDSKDYTPNFRV
jgi:hypothetical protein